MLTYEELRAELDVCQRNSLEKTGRMIKLMEECTELRKENKRLINRAGEFIEERESELQRLRADVRWLKTAGEITESAPVDALFSAYVSYTVLAFQNQTDESDERKIAEIGKWIYKLKEYREGTK